MRTGAGGTNAQPEPTCRRSREPAVAAASHRPGIQAVLAEARRVKPPLRRFAGLTRLRGYRRAPRRCLNWTGGRTIVRAVAKRLRCGRLCLLITLVLGLSACSAPTVALPAHHPQAIPTAASPRAEAYLLTAFDFTQRNYFYAKEINWSELKRKVFQRAESARTPSETYPAIRYLLLSLRPSDHTYFLSPEEAHQRTSAAEPNSTTQSEYPSGRLTPDGLGYLEIPSFGYTTAAQALSYATRAQSAIQSIATSSPCGWIVDLRGNVGGGIPPMLAAVGPILGDGRAGTFITATGDRIPWSYQHGSVVEGSRTTLLVPNAYELPVPGPPVAVLTNAATASAAEATLISFLGRPNTRTFGQRTAGAPSYPAQKKLSDGALISVVTAIEADRTGRVYQDNVPIPPEQPESSRVGSSDPTLEGADGWLEAQPACAR